MHYSSTKKRAEIVKKDYRKTIIFSQQDFGGDGHLLQVVTIPPNTKQRMHSHNKQTEIFYVLNGECTITINENDYFAVSGDAFICSPGDIHNLWNKTNHDFTLVVFKINLPKEGDDTNWIE